MKLRLNVALVLLCLASVGAPTAAPPAASASRGTMRTWWDKTVSKALHGSAADDLTNDVPPAAGAPTVASLDIAHDDAPAVAWPEAREEQDIAPSSADLEPSSPAARRLLQVRDTDDGQNLPTPRLEDGTLTTAELVDGLVAWPKIGCRLIQTRQYVLSSRAILVPTPSSCCRRIIGCSASCPRPRNRIMRLRAPASGEQPSPHRLI